MFFLSFVPHALAENSFLDLTKSPNCNVLNPKPFYLNSQALSMQEEIEHYNVPSND